MRIIEVCCSSLGEAREAAAGGARRIELCSAITCGGVTPSHGTIEAIAQANLNIDINVLIRPREGGFCFTGDEITTMCRDIEFCRKTGVHGVVIGALTHDGEIDIEACKRMIEAAGELSITFHRAFDVCRDPHKALEQTISLGCDRLLTSGQKPSAELGTELLAELVKQAAERIIIMPGAGINPQNIALIEQKTAATEFHSTAAINDHDFAYRGADVSFAAYPDREGIIRHSSREVVLQLVNNTL
ncbi:MAG: copper homeostasis protein CutC [Alistipes sp.]|nr:copper homeostasis protein CutC [Alistipes sp.]